MIYWLEILLFICSLLLALPVLILATEVLFALLPTGTRGVARPSGVRCVVLVPAHNEEAGIKTTLASIQEQLEPLDRILVIADNCTDGTATISRAAGADVVERVDANRRGKGFALDCGTRALEANPPDVVVILDADCLLRAGALGQLVAMAQRTGRPAQAVYCLESPPKARSLTQLSAFAFLFKNLVRPRGLARLGLPCLLTGSGMAFPWAVLRSAPLASGNIVEDMQLGLDLALAGHSPQLCCEARVDGVLPSGAGRRLQAADTLGTWSFAHPALSGSAPIGIVNPPRSSGLVRAGVGIERAAAFGTRTVLHSDGWSLVVCTTTVAGARAWLRCGDGHGCVFRRLAPLRHKVFALYLVACRPLLRRRQSADLPLLRLSSRKKPGCGR